MIGASLPVFTGTRSTRAGASSSASFRGGNGWKIIPRAIGIAHAGKRMAGDAIVQRLTHRRRRGDSSSVR
jgi:hypothetical protein